jgi:endoglucanase
MRLSPMRGQAGAYGAAGSARVVGTARVGTARVGTARVIGTARAAGTARGGRTAGAAGLGALGLAAVLAAAVLAATRAPASAAIPGASGALRGAAQPATGGVGTGFWHTSGNQIFDSAGNPVRIAGINWYGFETPDEIAHGLWAQDYHTVINDIKSLGYNTIRIPFSNQMVEDPIVPQNLSFYNNTGPINTDLEGLNALQDLQKIVDYAGQAGLKVILDDHRSEAGESAEANGLWYTSTYTSQDWVTDWVTLARMFAGNPAVVGFDLRNEPHTPAGDTYAQGATWGTGDPDTDIRLAYEQAGNAILAVDPGALIFCEGVSENPGSSGGYDSTWWGGDLAEAGQYPVVLSSPGHVVYSAHDYGPSLFQQTWFNSSTTPAGLDAVWNQFWGYLYAQDTAPVWVGEFGTDNAAADISSTTPGSQGQWFSALVSYLTANKWMGWTYWALNGEDSYALLDSNYDPAPVSAAKEDLLATIEFPLSGAATGSPSPTGSAAPVSCQAVYSLTSTWPGGFQAQVVLGNTGTTAISPWTLTFGFGGDQKIASLWNASFTQSGQQVTVTNEPYNSSIAPGSSVTVGFTGSYTSSNAAPAAFAVNGTACST